MSAPTADGGAAAIVCSEEFVNRHNLQVKYLCGLATANTYTSIVIPDEQFHVSL